MSALLKNFFFVIATGSVSACGASPLLHHTNAAATENSVKNEAPAEHVQSHPASDCEFRFPSAGVCASMQWIQRPTEDTEGSFTLKFWDERTGSDAGPYAHPGHDVAVKLFMPSMGHGSSPVTVTSTDQVGVYLATRVFFTMGGYWEIKVQLKDAGAVVEEAKVGIDI
ncbi:MAG: FixH family protein [Bdellovibrionales bacterium]|nr:FixH family protein [Bdellovibrionales bacterium]